jgi:hypothetical protein
MHPLEAVGPVAAVEHPLAVGISDAIRLAGGATRVANEEPVVVADLDERVDVTLSSEPRLVTLVTNDDRR